jgi:DNA-binding transcriptional LysR family regulator
VVPACGLRARRPPRGPRSHDNPAVDLKLLEDLAALDRERSFARAAESRHVTQPAFGRRIRTLEAWAGALLVDRSLQRIRLTEAGQALLEQAGPVVDGLLQVRERLKRAADAAAGPVLRLGTGTALARTLVADWLSQLGRARQPLHRQKVQVSTGSMADIGLAMERGSLDLVVCHHHPVSTIRLNNQRFQHLTIAKDRLVPVARADAQGRPRHELDSDALIGYAPSLALGAMLQDHFGSALSNAAARTRFVCDSPDAVLEFVRKGMGVAWLPWSMAAGDCRSGTLVALGRRSDEVHFDVRLYRPRAGQTPLVEAVWAAANR